MTTTDTRAAVEHLAGTVAPLVGVPVDELHVAAVLESRGVTDRIARDRYGHEDVFELAASVRPHLADAEPDESLPPFREDTWRPLVHGPLYLVPGLVVPALLRLGHGDQLLVGLVAATLVGWVWGMATSAVGYQLLGQEREAAAARAVALLSLAGLGVAALVTGGLALTGALGAGVVLAATTQATYQLAAGVLVFHRAEPLLGAAAAPAETCGVLYLVHPVQELAVTAVVVAGISVLVCAGAAGYVTLHALGIPEPPMVRVRLRPVRTVVPAVVQALVGAGLMLFTNTRFFHAGRDVALAATPLVLGMGVVEWRAERFVEAAARYARAAQDVVTYRRRLALRLVGELTLVLTLLGLAAAWLQGLLLAVDATTPVGIALAAGHAALGGVFFLGFVLARHANHPWALLTTALVVVAYVATALRTSGAAAATPSVLVGEFCAAVVALLLVLLAAFAVSNRQVQLFSW